MSIHQNTLLGLSHVRDAIHHVLISMESTAVPRDLDRVEPPAEWQTRFAMADLAAAYLQGVEVGDIIDHDCLYDAGDDVKANALEVFVTGNESTINSLRFAIEQEISEAHALALEDIISAVRDESDEQLNRLFKPFLTNQRE